MAKKKKGHKMPVWRKYAKIVVNGAFKIFGIAAASGPAAPAVANAISNGNINTLGQDVLYNYTGVSLVGKNIDFSQTLVGVGSVAGGIFLFWLGGQLAKHV